MTTYRDRHLAGHHDAKKLEAKEAKAKDESKSSTTTSPKKT